MKLLVTGGYGFIGSNLIRRIRRERPAWRVVNLDLVTYAANPANLADLEADAGYEAVRGDVADRELVRGLFDGHGFDAVIHCAAETHVDRSIHDSGTFLRTNVEGTLVLLEAALHAGGVRFLLMSTDEVYGSLTADAPPFTEATPLAPRSPYSASKAAADHMALAFHHTHALDVIVTRCSNNYGPYQHPEKLIPYMVTAALAGETLPVYGDGRQRRDWIFVEDHCAGVLAALEHGRAGEVYNFGGDAERENLDVVRAILRLTGTSENLLSFVADRPGHDRRYAMDAGKARRELGWAPAHLFEEGLEETVRWYEARPEWWSEPGRRARAESEQRIRAWAER